MISKTDLVQDLKNIHKKTGSIPSSCTYKREGKYHPRTIERKFGTWNKALLYVFGEISNKTPKKRYLKKCMGCDDMTLNPKFCSSSCAAIFNNKLRGAPPVCCKKCGEKTLYGSSFCPPCKKMNTIERYGKRTVGEFRRLPACAKNRYVPVRQHAARVMKYHKLVNGNCLLCDYSNHVQLCHIKDIGDFPDSATLSEINNPKNLIYLCPNHHWDLDHGYLSDKDKRAIASRRDKASTGN